MPLSPDEKKDIIDRLIADEKAERVDFNECADIVLTEEQVGHYSEELRTNPYLKFLGLRWVNESRDRTGMQAFASMLPLNSTLTELDLANMSVAADESDSDKGVRNALVSADMKLLADGLKGNRSLTIVSVYGNEALDEGAAVLAEMLRVNNTITEFDLSYNSITAVGVLALAEMLKVNTTLTRLFFHRNPIGDEGIKLLADAFEANTSLVRINLSKTKAGNEGLKRLAEAFKINETLTETHLFDNPFTAEGAQVLVEAVEQHNFFVAEIAIFNAGRGIDESKLVDRMMQHYARNALRSDTGNYIKSMLGANTPLMFSCLPPNEQKEIPILAREEFLNIKNKIEASPSFSKVPIADEKLIAKGIGSSSIFPTREFYTLKDKAVYYYYHCVEDAKGSLKVNKTLVLRIHPEQKGNISVHRKEDLSKGDVRPSNDHLVSLNLDKTITIQPKTQTSTLRMS